MLGEAAAKRTQMQSCMPGVCLTVPSRGGPGWMNRVASRTARRLLGVLGLVAFSPG